VAIFTKFFGRAASDAAGFAAGVAVGPALAPIVQEVVNRAWAEHPVRPPDVAILAAGVAQGQVDEADARQWAKERGYGDEQFTALVAIANAGPGIAEAYRAWRRGKLTERQFRKVLRRAAIEDEWADALVALKQELLDPVQLANAIHRGLIPDPGLLAVPPPSGTGNVPAYPVYGIDALEEAAGSGIDRDRLGALVGLTGLPMGAHEAAQAVFRHILTQTDYERAVAEGNTRNEWGDAIMEQSRQIPTARDFLENALRGYRTLAAAIQGAELHGMTPEHATMIYQNQGRPMAVRQITQALARGGVFKPEPGEIKDPFDAAIVEGNLKPAYYDLAKALRYTYPSAFVLRSLVQSGAITQAKGEEVLLFEGWEPGFAKLVSEAWAGGSGADADAHVGKAQTQLWTTLHRSYIAGESTKTAARPVLASLGLTTAAQDQVLALWDAERALVRKQLTPAQIKKAYTKGIKNQATGLTWTRDDALAALIERGYATTEANEFLDL
jgi:hypothetical protein